MLVDYKGGAAFAAAARLPHVTALVTDLDPALAARGLTSLRAELRRRERFLAATGASDLAAVATGRPGGRARRGWSSWWTSSPPSRPNCRSS